MKLSHYLSIAAVTLPFFGSTVPICPCLAVLNERYGAGVDLPLSREITEPDHVCVKSYSLHTGVSAFIAGFLYESGSVSDYARS